MNEIGPTVGPTHSQIQGTGRTKHKFVFFKEIVLECIS
jgi:hypothetical protein